MRNMTDQHLLCKRSTIEFINHQRKNVFQTLMSNRKRMEPCSPLWRALLAPLQVSAVCIALFILVSVAGWTQDLTELSLEELMDIEVTSVSKKTETLSEATTAIFVVTQKDIRRSGARHIADVLSMVPGLHVARSSANVWAVTSRGFNGRFANKLLVLIDGRSVYTPLFSGVYWNAQNLLLSDIERIEVIRGPGATLWGANAVNGVINVITKNAAKTRGTLLQAGGGSEERAFGSMRYGSQMGSDVSYRVYARYFDRDDSICNYGNHDTDSWSILHGGFRMDWQASDRDSLTFQGDFHDGIARDAYTVSSVESGYSQVVHEKTDMRGGNVLGRWTHQSSDTSETILQGYYDRSQRADKLLGETRDTIDLDFQQRWRLNTRQEVLWGLGYRLTMDDIDGSAYTSFDPSSKKDPLFGAFIQDEIVLAEDCLHLTLGTKLEHNNYTGFGLQPSMRMRWMASEHHVAWMAVSRALRTPSRSDHDIVIQGDILPPDALYPGSPLTITSVLGSEDAKAEGLLAFELGCRTQLTSRLFLDGAVFYNAYDHLSGIEPGVPYFVSEPSPPHVVYPLLIDNKTEATSYGIEVVANWHMSDRWQLYGAYSHLRMRYAGESERTSYRDITGESPCHQAFLRSSMDLPGNLECDLDVRYISELPSLEVPSYVGLDLRLNWRIHPNIELFVVGRDLLEEHHPEFVSEYVQSLTTEIERSVYGGVRCQF